MSDPVILYTPRGIPYGRKVESALALKKLPYRVVEPQRPEDYERWSPETGLLPAIELEGERFWDSSYILDLLDRRFPEPPLLSPDPRAARSQRRLEQWAEAAFTFYWIHHLSAIADGGAIDASYASADLAGELQQRLDDLVNFLGGRPYFYADQPSRADLAVHSFLAGIAAAIGTEAADQVIDRPALKEHLDRIGALTADG